MQKKPILRFRDVPIKKDVYDKVAAIAEKELVMPSEAIDSILSRYAEIYWERKGGKGNGKKNTSNPGQDGNSG